MRLAIILSLLVTFILCCKKQTEPEVVTGENKSAADLVAGSYTGTAKRWYWNWNQGPPCQYSTAFPNYEKQGVAEVVVTKVTDSTINISIVSPNNQFNAFAVSNSTGLIKVRKDGSNILANRNIQYNLNGGGGVLRGSEYFNLTGKAVSIRIDHSVRSAFNTSCGSGAWDEFNIVEVNATR